MDESLVKNEGLVDASRTTRVSESLGILVVDDFAPFRESLHGIFRDHKLLTIVGEAADGVVAIEMAVRLAPHVVIMDVIMPRMNGVEAARLMKEHWQEIAIIGLCVALDTSITDAFLKAGALAVISKDQVDHLYSTIQRAWSQKMIGGVPRTQ